MSTYLLGYIYLIQMFLHPRLRRQANLSFINSLLGWDDGWNFREILKIASVFFNFGQEFNKIYNHCGQTMIFEQLLMLPNDFYSNVTITIDDAVRAERVFLYNKTESYNPVYLWNKEEEDAEPLMLYNKEEYYSDVDFIVRVDLPVISDDYKAYLGSLIDKFKIAGKKYKIVTQNE